MSEKTCETCEHRYGIACCNELARHWSIFTNRRDGEPCGPEAKLWEASTTPPPPAPPAFGINSEVRCILARYFRATPEQMDAMQAVTIEARGDHYIKATVVIVGTEPKAAHSDPR